MSGYDVSDAAPVRAVVPRAVAVDLETYRIGPGAVAPRPVCVSLAEHAPSGAITSSVLHARDPLFVPFWKGLLAGEGPVVLQRGSYDLSCLVVHFPELIPSIFDALYRGVVTDTRLRERLINLSTHGQIEALPLPDGSSAKISYSLESLARQYLGVDLSADKRGEDSWRLNYFQLDDVPLERWPEEAVAYARQDAELTLAVYQCQELRREEDGGSTTTEEFNAGVALALQLATCRGVEIDPAERERLKRHVEEELSPSKMMGLYEAGVLSRGEPARPHKRGAKGPDGLPKMVAAKPDSLCRARLEEIVSEVCERHGVEKKLTPSGRVCADAEVIERLAPYSEVLGLFRRRQEFSNLASKDLPALEHDVVHFPFEVLVRTTRTASSADGLFPSRNGQNVDPRVRPCHRAREGWLVLSIDYAGIELCTAAQTCFSLFGQSRLREVINSGRDAHAYLGGLLAFSLHDDFRASCQAQGLLGLEHADQVYDAFFACKGSDVEYVRAFYDHWRTLAKPTGLGYWGGLGPDTFTSYAKAQFGLDVTVSQADQMRDVWRMVFPEQRLWFNHVEQECRDPRNPGEYWYQTPLGAVRRGAAFTEVSNGKALQSPTAEGAKWALFDFTRACYDQTVGSILYDACAPFCFLHDEILAEVLDDDLAHERACEGQRIMVRAMREICPDVQVRTEAKLSRRWYKEAKPVLDERGRLVPWEPKRA